ncbi:ABC transporter permease [Virgisporangium aliadipatigenens]|uniref:ABC transporter permease n=1 Tax=Virgisporangium aliadipatigenens TaxID=741659 RepID=A0A8J3YG62_9ACTN|nr:ABC transporter ATP-binding protein [Virgisporangium aliadipatigenens]GIJ43642.1 ABC transporter permease [Virgisporangium aliadipatigenens]
MEEPLTANGLLRRTLRRHRGRLVAGVLLLCAHQGAEVAVPVAIGVIIDRAVATGDATAIALSVLALAGLFTCLSLAWRGGARLTTTAIERETHRIRVEIAQRALDPRGHTGGLRDGELLSVASSDAENTTVIVRACGVTLAATTALVAAAAALLVIDVPLGVGVLIGVPLIVLGLQRLAPLLTRRGEEQQAALADTGALATDLVSGLRVLRGIGAQHTAAQRYAAASERALDATLRTATAKGVHRGLTSTVNGLFLAAVAGFAGWRAVDGALSVGELVAVVGLAQFIAEPVQTFGFCVQMYAIAKASAGRVAALLGTPLRLTPGDRSAPAAADVRVRLDGVSYRTLDAVSLRARAGELLGVVAYDPRDADALRLLLAGRVPRADYAGVVALDDVPTQELNLDESRRVVLAEPHRTRLFEGSLRENLLPGGDGPDGQLAGAIRAAAADDVVDAHPDGLEHRLDEGGTNLSGGQRQRIALARALAADPPVLVLHDPTTAVDPVTEGLIADGIARLRRDRSTIVITSSPMLLDRVDRVVVLDGGRVVAEGTHADLVDGDRRYRELVLR